MQRSATQAGQADRGIEAPPGERQIKSKRRARRNERDRDGAKNRKHPGESGIARFAGDCYQQGCKEERGSTPLGDKPRSIENVIQIGSVSMEKLSSGKLRLIPFKLGEWALRLLFADHIR